MENYLEEQNNPENEKDFEINHLIGLNTQIPKCVQSHPTMNETIIYGVGSILIAEDLNEKNNQVFFRHGKNHISCFSISNTGRFIAVGFTTSNLEKNLPASIIIWDYEKKKVVYELTGIYKSVSMLEFSQDDKFLVASGLDNSIFIWDILTGEKCFGRVYEFATILIKWTAFTYDKKYPNYTITYANVNSINYFNFTFELKSMQYNIKSSKFTLPSNGYVRNYTAAIKDKLNNILFIGTSGGELTLYNLDNLYYKASYNVANNGLTGLIQLEDNSLIISGGDGKVKKLIFENNKPVLISEIQLNGKVSHISLTADQKEVIASTNTGYIYRILVEDFSFMVHSISHVSPVNDCSYFNNSDNEKLYCVDDSVKL
jgi:WD40 repeat protein